jgi:lysophospholipase L1-like esterase
VIIALGANDLKSRFGLAPGDIADGAGALVEIVQRSEAGVNGAAPKVLLICPPPLAQMKAFAYMFVGGEAKSRLLAPEYQRVAQERGCAFLNAGDVIRCSEGDGLHFDPGEQQKLGRKVAERVREMMG